MATKSSKQDRVDPKEIAKRNPSVNAEHVSEALKMVRELRKMGVTGSGYNVRNPYSSTPVHCATDDAWQASSGKPDA